MHNHTTEKKQFLKEINIENTNAIRRGELKKIFDDGIRPTVYIMRLTHGLDFEPER